MVTNTGKDTDIDLVQCSVCKRTFKKAGLKQHQTKMGCKEHLSDLHRNTSKTEATSTPDSNHSGASGRVRLKTTHRGNGAQEMEAMVKVNKQIKRKKMDKSCSEGGKVVANGRRIERKTEERGEKTDIRNWLKKNEPVDKGFPMKVKEDANEETGIVLVDITEEGDEEVGQAKENTDIEIVDLEEELKNKDMKTVTSR